MQIIFLKIVPQLKFIWNAFWFPFFPGKMTRKCVRIYFVTFSSHSQWLSTCPFFNKNFSQVTIYYLNISSIYVYLTYLSYLLQKKCERQLVLCLHYYSFYYRYIPTTHLIIFAAILIWTTQFKCFLFIESWDYETLLSITTKMVHGNIGITMTNYGYWHMFLKLYQRNHNHCW